MKRGFLLGKFLPPHMGHLFLCRTAARLCDQLTVLVCSLPEDPIPGEKRFAWMKELLPSVRMVHHDRPAPQEPGDHPEFWKLWKDICQEAHPEPIELVFGSEPYVNRLADELGAKPLIVDTARIAFPVSGTAVRDNPTSAWRYIPGVVRPYFQKRVVLFGAESTGKSTMAEWLARRFGSPFVPEYGRTYDANRSSDNWTRQDFEAIADGHEAMRATIAPEAGPVLIEDTDPLLTRVWEEFLLGKPHSTTFERPLADLYLLQDIDMPWQDDGTRYQGDPQARKAFHDRCRQLLDEVGANWQLIIGSVEQRRAQCIKEIAEFL
jgi:HTH-type transcriptional regulator, transcriptional repressor of NAD biosynthesis genes